MSKLILILSLLTSAQFLYAQQDSIFLRVEYDSSKMQIGANLHLDLRIYTTRNIESIELIKDPEIDAGILHRKENYRPPAPVVMNVNGTNYASKVLNSYIYQPLIPGKHEIRPAKILCSFSDGTMSEFNPFKLTTDSIQSLPTPPLMIKTEEKLSTLNRNLIQLSIEKNDSLSTENKLVFDLQMKTLGNPLFCLPPSLDLEKKAMVQTSFLKQEVLSPSHDSVITIKYYRYHLEFYKKQNYDIQLKTESWQDSSQKVELIQSNHIQFSPKNISKPQKLAPPKANIKNDIVLIADISSSMLAKDFEPNRLEHMKKLMKDLIAQKTDNQRMAIVAFAGASFTQIKLTTDSSSLIKAVEQLNVGKLKEGTAINLSLLSALGSFEENQAGKNVILFTDGVNNIQRWAIPSSEIIAQIACSMGVSIQSIGIGSEGTALVPIAVDSVGNYRFDYAPTEIDEPLLKSLSESTCGSYERILLQENRKLNLQELLSKNSKKTDEYLLPKVVVENLLDELRKEGEALRASYLEE
jgi:hypothetical protein